MLKTNPFTIQKNGQELDYFTKDNFDLKKIKEFFKTKSYQVLELSQPHRNIVGILEKDSKRFRLKLAGSVGMNELLQTEIDWNMQVNQVLPRPTSTLWVPEVKTKGKYTYKNTQYTYYLADEFKGRPLVDYPKNKETVLLKRHLNQVIDASETIAKLNITLTARDYADRGDHRSFFLSKTRKWLMAIPEEIRNRYQLNALFDIVKTGAPVLAKSFRHGDFAPWHLFALENGKLGLIDGEHATSEGVQYYDIAYLIQRVFQVLQDENLAKEIHRRLMDRGYDQAKLKTVLASRAIGGFLDEQVGEKNFRQAEKFKNWVLQ